MSASDSGLMIIAAPILLTISAVSFAGACITAAAEKYRRYRLGQAEELENQKRLELDKITELSEQNQKEYEEDQKWRKNEEDSRRQREKLNQDTAKIQKLEEERLKEEIHEKINRMETAIRRFEVEFGENTELRSMAATLIQSEKTFGDGPQLINDLDDVIFTIIPGMTEEKRDELHKKQLTEKLESIAANNRKTVDSSEHFVSLYSEEQKGTSAPAKTPWDSFLARVKAVADVEQSYFGTDAAQILEEAEKVEPNRRNFYIQQHMIQLDEMEEEVSEYKTEQVKISEKVMEDYYMYLAMARKLEMEPAFSENDLTDEFAIARMREETEAMAGQYKKECEKRYTVNAFTTVMKRHGLIFENMTAGTDGLTNIEYSMDEQTGVLITHSESGAFEMQFQGKSQGSAVSMDEKRTVAEKAKHFCTVLPEIRKELEEEFGISFQQTDLQPASIENIQFRTMESSDRRKKAVKQKTMKMK